MSNGFIDSFILAMLIWFGLSIGFGAGITYVLRNMFDMPLKQTVILLSVGGFIVLLAATPSMFLFEYVESILPRPELIVIGDHDLG